MLEDNIEITEENIEETPPIEVITNEENQIMTAAAGTVYVGNETEFRNALALQASTIVTRQSIKFTSPIYINYSLKIVADTNDNALQYGAGGSFINVQNGGSLVLDKMVIDTNSSGGTGMNAINIENGGYVTFINSSIVDGGKGNIGILINGGGSLLLWSCKIVNCNYGIKLQGNGGLYFATQDGKCNNFYNNNYGVFIDNFWGNCNFDQNIAMYNNSDGIVTGNSTGTVNVSAGDYYSNYNGINCGGNVTVTGGNYYSNNNGMCTNEKYSGSLTINNANIHSNMFSSVYHDKAGDNTCIINGGAISGQVYLAQNDNYINTNSNYPTLTILPSTYYSKRKLVKTTNNSIANNQISKVTLIPKDNWYTYVQNEYIVLDNNANVVIRCKDYFGNVIKQESISGTVGQTYSVTAPNISGYDLISSSSSVTGTYTQGDTIVEFKYDLVNVAKVNFEDILSGVVSAKYWYNASSQNFTGNGTSFANGAIFEQYGYYKIVVTNGVGLEKTLTFTLNKNSYTR